MAIFYTELLTRKVDLWSFSQEWQIWKSTYQDKISVVEHECKRKTRDLAGIFPQCIEELLINWFCKVNFSYFLER